mgnify:CR=1 FL=1
MAPWQSMPRAAGQPSSDHAQGAKEAAAPCAADATLAERLATSRRNGVVCVDSDDGYRYWLEQPVLQTTPLNMDAAATQPKQAVPTQQRAAPQPRHHPPSWHRRRALRESTRNSNPAKPCASPDNSSTPPHDSEPDAPPPPHQKPPPQPSSSSETDVHVSERTDKRARDELKAPSNPAKPCASPNNSSTPPHDSEPDAPPPPHQKPPPQPSSSSETDVHVSERADKRARDEQKAPSEPPPPAKHANLPHDPTLPHDPPNPNPNPIEPDAPPPLHQEHPPKPSLPPGLDAKRSKGEEQPTLPPSLPPPLSPPPPPAPTAPGPAPRTPEPRSKRELFPDRRGDTAASAGPSPARSWADESGDEAPPTPTAPLTPRSPSRAASGGRGSLLSSPHLILGIILSLALPTTASPVAPMATSCLPPFVVPLLLTIAAAASIPSLASARRPLSPPPSPPPSPPLQPAPPPCTADVDARRRPAQRAPGRQSSWW